MHMEQGQVLLDPGDLHRFKLISANFPVPELPPAGRWLVESPDQLWLEFVAQITAIGGRRPVDRMWENGDIRLLSINSIHGVIKEEDRPSAELWVHRILSRNGVRYCSPAALVPSTKAKQIVEAACSPILVRDGTFLIRELLSPLLPSAPTWDESSRKSERAARRRLVRGISGVGMKSASDYLNHIGASLNLIAFDSRILTLLRSCFGLGNEVWRYIGSLGRYEELERPFVEEVCPYLGMSPASLDQLLFAYSEPARRLLSGREDRHEQGKTQ